MTGLLALGRAFLGNVHPRRRRMCPIVGVLALAAIAALLVGSYPFSSRAASNVSPSLVPNEPHEGLPPAAAGSPAPAWIQIPTHGSPEARYGAQMAYDGHDGYTVLYGGSSEAYTSQNSTGGELYSDTWTYWAGTWTRLASSGPPARLWESMAYDPADGYIVLFGGNGNCDLCNQTWTFSGGEWTELDTRNPQPRSGGALAWDPTLGELLLTGGIYPIAPLQYITDTWSFVHGVWTNLSIAGPAPSFAPSVGYSPALGGLVLFGGAYNYYTPTGNWRSDTWFFDGQWTNRSDSGPSGRAYAQISPEPSVGDAVLFGGLTDRPAGGDRKALGDTWAYDGVVWQELSIPGPSNRYWSTMAYDAADGYVVLFGGAECADIYYQCSAPSPLGDTWSFSMGNVAPAVSVSVTPPAICVLNDTSCAAGGWQATVNFTVRPVYSPRPLGGGSLDDPVLTVLPWGEVRLDESAPPFISCHLLYPEPESCNQDPVFEETGPSAGFRLNWSLNPYIDTLHVGDSWSVEFGIIVAAPPYGTVPVYACDTAQCLAEECGPIAGSFSSVAFRPLSVSPFFGVSLPYASVNVDAPLATSGNGAPPPTSPPPPPAPSVPVGLPVPIALPTPVPAPVPIASIAVLSVSTVSITAIAAGVLAAGFARVALQRRAISIGQPVGSPIRAKLSTFEPERPSDHRAGRFE